MSEPIQSIAQNNYILQAPPPTATMFTTELEYDGDKISGYAGSAFKAGTDLEFGYTDTDTISSINTSALTDVSLNNIVQTNSASWGGNALPISAGPGIKVNLVDNTLVFSNDETVLYESPYSANNTQVILSEPISGFESFKVVWQLGGSEPGNRFIDEYESSTKQINVQHTNSIGTQYYYYFLAFWANNTSSFNYNYTYLMNIPKSGSPTILSNQYNEIQPIKVIGINRK